MGFDAAEGRGVLWEIEETRREEKRRAPENAGGGSCFRGIKRMWWAMVFGSLDFSESRRPKPYLWILGKLLYIISQTLRC